MSFIEFQNQTIEPPAMEPVVLIDEPQEMEQNVAGANDSVYDCDTQLIQPAMINEESIPVPGRTEAVRAFFKILNDELGIFPV